MANLVVKDEEYESFKEGVKKIGLVAENQLKSYLDILDQVLGGAITSGITYDNLKLYRDQAQKLKGLMEKVCQNTAEVAAVYVEEIDLKDSYVY